MERIERRDPELPAAGARSVRQKLIMAALFALALLSCLHFVHLAREVRAEGFFDFPIFLGHARRLLATGVLYVEDLSKYHAGARIYKYPPLYAVLLVPALRLEAGEIYLYHWLLQIGIYLSALGLAIWLFMPRTAWWFIPAALIPLLNLGPFFETLAGLQVEGPILLLLLLCAFFFSRGMGALAGMALGIAVMLKVYPVFLLLYFGIRARWSVIAGCMGTMVVITLGTIWAIGPAENAKYFMGILPHISGELPKYSPESVAISRYLMHLRGVDPNVAKRIAQLIFLALLGATSLAVARHRSIRNQPERDLLGFAAFVAVMLLGLTNSWLNYQLLLVIGIVCALSHCARGPAGLLEPRRRTLLIATLLSCFFLLFSPNAPMFDSVLSREIRETLTNLRIISTILIWGTLVFLLFSLPLPVASSAGAQRRRELDRDPDCEPA